MTNELKEKLLAYGTKAEPFTVHNHIRVTDLQDGEARVELTDRSRTICRHNPLPNRKRIAAR